MKGSFIVVVDIVVFVVDLNLLTRGTVFPLILTKHVVGVLIGIVLIVVRHDTADEVLLFIK
jgi:hypothetical protein